MEELRLLTLSLQAMNPFRTGKLVMFQVTYDRDWHFFEYFFTIIIGIFGVSYFTVVGFNNDHLLTMIVDRVFMVHSSLNGI
jgi:hypothetical protein